MRQLPRWGYLLFVTVLLVGSVAWFRDFTLVMLMTSLWVTEPIYRKLDTVQQRKWIIPCGIVLALVLGGLYYIADLFIFPHSPRAVHRVHDACLMGPLWAFFGLLAVYWSPGRKRVVQDHAINGTAT